MIDARVFGVADMLTDDELVCFDVTESILQIRTRCEDVCLRIVFCYNWCRYISACSAKQNSLAVDKMHNRIIHLPVDFAVVHQKSVGNTSQFFEGFSVLTNKRFIRDIPAGHNQNFQFFFK